MPFRSTGATVHTVALVIQSFGFGSALLPRCDQTTADKLAFADVAGRPPAARV